MGYNIGSLALGLASWAIPVFAMLKGAKIRVASCAVSLVCCAAAPALQVFEIRRRVRLSDWSALADTIDAVAFACVILIAVAVVLNAAALKSERA